MKYRDLYFKIINDNKDNPHFEASALKLLFLDNEDTDFISLLDKEIDDKKLIKLQKQINLYLNLYPVAYILGYSYFYGLKLHVNKNVLIPRSETEILVEKLLLIINQEFNNKKISILDIGCGSGAIGLALKSNLNNSIVTMIDKSKKALKVAKENNISLSLDINIIYSDIYNNLNDEKYDVIVSNPPYINDINDVDIMVLNNEPKMALFEKSDLYFYKRIFKDANKHLNKHGIIAVEHGYNQKEKILALAKQYFPKSIILTYQDYNLQNRVIIIINRG